MTEQITGLDLVKLQILVAEGKKLPFKQEDLRMNGHAVEIRVYAEDPANHFLPDIGTLDTYRRPQGHGIRVDDGFEQGMDIPFYYDPMIAKLICHAEDRAGAIEKMIRAIDEYEITGLETTLGFCRFVMQHEAFRSGHFDTGFVEKYFKPATWAAPAHADEERLAALLAASLSARKPTPSANGVAADGAPPLSKWKKNRMG